MMVEGKPRVNWFYPYRLWAFTNQLTLHRKIEGIMHWIDFLEFPDQSLKSYSCKLLNFPQKPRMKDQSAFLGPKEITVDFLLNSSAC